MRTSHRELSDDTLRIIAELKPIVGRLSSAIENKRDPFDAVSSLVSRVNFIENELSKAFLDRNRVFCLTFLEEFLLQNQKEISIVLPEAGVPLRLLSTLSEIIFVIIRRNPKLVNVIAFESLDGFALSCVLQGVNINRISSSSLHNAISMLDGYASILNGVTTRIAISNLFGKERFIVVDTKYGKAAIPWLLVENVDDLNDSSFGNTISLDLRLGTSKKTFKLKVLGIEDALRSVPKTPFEMPWFKGVFISSCFKPVPVLNVFELFEKDGYEWLL